MSLTIGVPSETFAGEKRVATVPEVVEKLIKLGFKVCVEQGAGAAANFSDHAYQSAGASIAGSAAELYAAADVVFKVRPPTAGEVGQLREGTTFIGFVWPAQHPDLMQQLASRKGTVLAIDSLPARYRAPRRWKRSPLWLASVANAPLMRLHMPLAGPSTAR